MFISREFSLTRCLQMVGLYTRLVASVLLVFELSYPSDNLLFRDGCKHLFCDVDVVHATEYFALPDALVHFIGDEPPEPFVRYRFID